MQLELGQKIRELRHRDGRTQETLAEALGVTTQAISRWEANGGYPDMETIPAIANYFGVSIDELFGYENDRERKIDAVIAKVDSFGIRTRNDGPWFDECIAILREGLAEFPANERIMITLAETLWETGWRRNREYIGYDDDGFIQYCYDKKRENEYWSECAKICEQLIENGRDNAVYMRAVAVIVPLYRNYGEYEKAISYAKRMPDLKKCRDYLLTEATDGKLNARYTGEFLLHAAQEFSEQLIFNLVSNRNNFESDVPMKKVEGAIALFDLICDDGNYGLYNDILIKLRLYLSRLQWERGYHDEAFESLDKALYHAKELERLIGAPEHKYTAPLVSFVIDIPAQAPDGYACVARELPGDWPFWCNPEFSKVEKEIKADPRWEEWAKKTKE
ncbi:MAG: helix-turn-helix transcriptional regulator [Clostridia bacterium]|nr:helix-turn-helix transcriptional regulator [Clostridia bacterium]